MKLRQSGRFMLMMISGFILLGASSLFAEEYLPLQIGNFWDSANADGLTESRTIVGLENVFGSDTYVMEYSENPDNDGLRNYWTSNDEGDVFLWGFLREFGLRYDPPIMMVDGPLSLGQTWDVVSDAYQYPGGDYVGTFEFTFQVMEEGIYQVEAGSFPAFGVGVVEDDRTISMLGKYSFDGTLRGADGRSVETYYTEGVGEIIYNANYDPFSLVRYHGSTVATEIQTWDSVKALFR